MNRVIKFRAWDIQRNEYLPSDCFAVLPTCDFGATAVMVKDYDNYKEGEYFYPKHQILQQFTGLLDKNGKEIYEGDIVRRRRKTINGYKDMVVRFENFQWSIVKQVGWDGEIWFDSDFDELEIIGNLFETTELLNSINH